MKLPWQKRAPSFLENEQPPAPSLTTLKRIVKILVIDDEEDQFPLSFFRDQKYNINYWPDVKNLNELEEGEYDIIILDIAGVGTSITHNEGLGVLEHIKKVNPEQIVIAFSQQRFSLDKQAFWRLADDTIEKPIDALSLKRKIDDLIQNHINFNKYIILVQHFLRKQLLTEDQITAITRSIKEGSVAQNPEPIKAQINKIIPMADLSVKILNLAMKAYQIHTGHI